MMTSCRSPSSGNVPAALSVRVASRDLVLHQIRHEISSREIKPTHRSGKGPTVPKLKYRRKAAQRGEGTSARCFVPRLFCTRRSYPFSVGCLL